LSYILNIETATTVCSVSLSQNEEVLFSKELNEGFTHAENLHLFIEQALKETRLKANQLNAIGVSKGPGSYTGLRIGVSTAKGLAYALNIPLISVDTLQIMAGSVLSKIMEPDAFYCPMIDARRMEVYTAVFDSHLKIKTEIEALIVDELSIEKFKDYQKIYYFGDGAAKCQPLLSQLKNTEFIEGISPTAAHMTKLVHTKYLHKTFENIAYFEPFYLKNFMILKKKVKI